MLLGINRMDGSEHSYICKEGKFPEKERKKLPKIAIDLYKVQLKCRIC